MLKDSWDSIIDYTKAQLSKEDFSWYNVEIFRKSLPTRLVSKIIGQYMRALEALEEKTKEPAPPDLNTFKKSYKLYYEIAVNECLAELGTYNTTDTEKNTALAIRPIEHIGTIDKVSNTTFANKLTVAIQAIAVEKRGSATPVNTYVSINYDGLARAKIEGVKWLEPFDREVLDAVHTLFKAGNTFITVNQIYRVLTGKKGEEQAPKALANDIWQSINKMMYTQLSIDATEEATAFGYSVYKYDSPMIVAEKVEIKLNGTLTTALKIHALGLLGYAEIKNQIARVPLRIRDTPIKKNKEIINLQGYLERAIEIRRNSRLNNTILLDTVLDDLCIIKKTDTQGRALNNAEKLRRSKAQKNILNLLEYWREPTHGENPKEHIGYIKNYSIEGSRPLKGFTIIF